MKWRGFKVDKIFMKHPVSKIWQKMARKSQEQRVRDEVPKSWAPGAPFLTWAPIGAPFGAPVLYVKMV